MEVMARAARISSIGRLSVADYHFSLQLHIELDVNPGLPIHQTPQKIDINSFFETEGSRKWQGRILYLEKWMWVCRGVIIPMGVDYDFDNIS